MPGKRSVTALLLACALGAVFSAEAAAAPTFDDVAAAERRVEELQGEISELEAERLALETRLDVTNDRIIRQHDVVEQTEQDLDAARTALAVKLVAMYKARRPDPISLLLESRTVADLVSRTVLLSRIAESDREILRESAVAADEAAYQMLVLDDLKAQDTALRHELGSRERRLSAALTEQQELAERLGREALQALAARQAAAARDRQAWSDSSVPLNSTITFVSATVDEHPGATWLVPVHRPTAYRSSGSAYSAVCSWYGNEFHGRRTASGQIFNENDFTCASNAYPFGTTLALSRGDRRIIVVVNDRGPFVWSGTSWLPHPVRKLDLSKASAYALGFTGIAEVRIEPVVAR